MLWDGPITWLGAGCGWAGGPWGGLGGALGEVGAVSEGMILTETVAAAGDCAGPPCEGLVIQCSVLHRPVEVLRECCPAAVAAIVHHPRVTLEDPARPND